MSIVMKSDDYYKRWGKLPEMKEGSLVNMFGNGVSVHNRPLVSRRAIEVLPGIYSFDPLYLAFLRALSEQLNDSLHVSMDGNKFTDTGIHTSFDRLRTVPGYMMNPMSYTMVDNQSYRKELGLKPGYNPKQKRIARNVWRLLFSSYKPSAVKVTKKSASGPRRNTSDHEWKQDFALHLFESGRFEQMLDAVDRDDWLTLANEFETLYMTYIQKRDQVDTPGKERMVADLDYAMSSGGEGKMFAADKRVVIDGVEYPDFSATRARVIHAGPWVINCFLSIITTGTMQGMFELYPNTFHVNTDEDIKKLVDGHLVWCGDVKEYDRSMPEDALDEFHNAMSEFWDPRLAKASECLYFSAYYSRPLDLDGKRGKLVGNPTAMGKQVNAGNRSGHAATSLVAKGNKVIETLCLFDAMGLKVEGNEKAYLEGNMEIAVINNGDDEVVRTKSPQLMERFKKVRTDPEAVVYSVEAEDGQVYSGKILRVDNFGDDVYYPTPRLATGFEKIYTPERPIGGLFRPYWHIGVTERMSSRGLHPMGEIAWEIHDRLFTDMLAPRFGTLWGMVASAALNAPVHFHDLTAADSDVLDNPDRLHYRYKDGEISDEVIALSSVSIPFHAFEHIVDRYYTGHVI